ncbi:MAG: sensor histidine kinase [Terriglobales bacterium]
MDSRFILVSLLVKLGVAAAVSSALVRSRYFKWILFREERTLAQQIYLAVFIAMPFALGVIVRVSVKNFVAADLAFEAAVLIGVVGGKVPGLLGGLVLGLPAIFSGEYGPMSFYAVSGLLAGMVRSLALDSSEIWSFTPFLDLSIYRWFRRHMQRPFLDWQSSFVLVVLGLQFVRIQLGRAFPTQFFIINPISWGTTLAVYATTLACVAIPVKIWNNTRIEIKLEEQERLLLQARMEALQSQINPHFLFNTLNSIASLVRFDPDMARVLIVKLANILRRLLRKGDSFVPLREEVDFIDDYLDIEVVRFGQDKLRVVKELDPATLEMIVPSMLLQPLIENCIKHGLAPQIEGGSIVVRSVVSGGMLNIEVEDDGVGMTVPGGSAPVMPGPGIGMSNVAERLKVLYGETATMVVSSSGGKGTRVTIRVPVLAPVEVEGGLPVYEARSSTSR